MFLDSPQLRRCRRGLSPHKLILATEPPPSLVRPRPRLLLFSREHTNKLPIQIILMEVNNGTSPSLWPPLHLQGHCQCRRRHHRPEATGLPNRICCGILIIRVLCARQLTTNPCRKEFCSAALFKWTILILSRWVKHIFDLWVQVSSTHFGCLIMELFCNYI